MTRTIPLPVLVIGIGPHARAFYLPVLRDYETAGRVSLAGLVDLEPQKTPLESWCDSRGIRCPRLYLPPFSGTLPPDARARLDAFLRQTEARGVIISTDPLSHKCYALWAMEHGLHILMDKPVTTAIDAVSNEHAARSIETDYDELAAARARLHGGRAFILCAHRRYHPGFDTALSLVTETVRQTGCPVTSQHAYHSDGQWRLPHEILTQDHHSYHQGHGKLSHSGFHFLDVLCRFRAAGSPPGKAPEEAAVTAAFLLPDGFLTQITPDDYLRLFGPECLTAGLRPAGEMLPRLSRCGEMDIEASISFLRSGRVFALASLSLLHGGFSRRAWLRPGADLYKGNGRVKHEHHRIHVGPFLSVQIHSCQAKDRHDTCTESDSAIGGNNHFELWIFRNTGMIGGDPFERVTFNDLAARCGFRSDSLFIEQVKRGAVAEFLDRAAGRLSDSDLRSDFSAHRMPVRLMSALYLSHIARASGASPLITVPWTDD